MVCRGEKKRQDPEINAREVSHTKSGDPARTERERYEANMPETAEQKYTKEC